jgi:hypothetical protein
LRLCLIEGLGAPAVNRRDARFPAEQRLDLGGNPLNQYVGVGIATALKPAPSA